MRVKSLLTFLLAFFLFVKSFNFKPGYCMASEKFIADIFSSTTVLDPALIYSAGQYIVVSHIVRPLTKLNKYAEIEGDVLESWSIKDDFKEFHLKVNPKSLWSDGTPVTAKDVANSLSRQIKLKSANHFNFSIIKEIEVKEELYIIIYLKSKNVNFIRQMSYPEFGVLSEEDCLKDKGKLSLKKTSGPYQLKLVTDVGFELIKNHYYDGFSPTAPELVEFRWSSIQNKIKGLMDGSIDFAIPFQSMTNDMMKSVKQNPNLNISHPHIGYSFWFSINPNSPVFKDKHLRYWMQMALNTESFNFSANDVGWEHAYQLYLPDGLGRPSQDRIKDIWKIISKNAAPPRNPLKIKVVSDKEYPHWDQLKRIFKERNIEYSIDIAKTTDEFFSLLQKNKYDLIEGRNDFSSADLHENLQTTFNPLVPMIITSKDDDNFQKELKTALNTEDEQKRHQIYQNIAERILLEGYIVPTAYYRILFVHKKSVDISNWSNLFPELSLWKVNIKK